LRWRSIARPTTHGRGALAESILQVCLQNNANLSAKEFEITFDILRKLISNVEMEVRRTIAERLALRGDLPHDIALFLANDQIEVAYPVLVDSAALEDIDLILIARGKPASHQIAVTLRRNLSEAVSNVLVDTKNVDVIDSLLRNPSAIISNDAMEQMVEMSRSVPPLHKPLLQRDDLPPDLAWRMYGWVGAALKNFIIDTFPESSPSIETAIDDVIDRALASSHDNNDFMFIDEDEPAPITTSDLVRILETEGVNAFGQSFAYFSGLNVDAMPNLFADTGGESVAIVCKACGVPVGDFLRIFVLLRAQLNAPVSQDSSDFQAVSNFFKRLDIKSANSILSEWRASPPDTTKLA
jgi:uncharacterized protein (DUF2336 family)